VNKNVIDINCDMAELDTVDDIAFMPFISSCNICCGSHAGSPEKIIKTIRAALQQNLKIGAHPSYPDRENFGRKSIDINASDLYDTLIEQVSYIQKMVEKEGGRLHHVKAHGALYNDLFHNSETLDVFLKVVENLNTDIKIYALAHSQLKDKIIQQGLSVISEAFMDRRYTKEGLLASRSLSGNVFDNLDQVIAQLDFLLKKKVQTELTDIYDLPHETICLHSDTPQAQEWIPEIYKFIKSRGFEIA